MAANAMKVGIVVLTTEIRYNELRINKIVSAAMSNEPNRLQNGRASAPQEKPGKRLK
jgi:hypothetical protein